MERAFGWAVMLFIGILLLITSVQGRVGVLLACFLVPDNVQVNPIASAIGGAASNAVNNGSAGT